MHQEFLPPAAIERQKKKRKLQDHCEIMTIKKCTIDRESTKVLKKGKTVCAGVSCIALWAAADISSIKQFIQHSSDHANED
jgi:hypothetical protein